MIIARCVSLFCRNCFEDLFANKVKQLLHNFPLDRVTSTGAPFWYVIITKCNALFCSVFLCELCSQAM